TLCPVCRVEEETVNHFFRDCIFTQQHARRSCSGVIVRNKEGLVIASCTYPWGNILDPIMAEARKKRSCVSSVIQEINGRTPNFRRLCFKYVPIEVSKAAHGMALKGWRYEDPQYWMKEVPHAVEGLVNRDRKSGNDGG
ncbi:hypothetical protein Goari_027285, partial [Gossypium aridum]|nr:hypothetical protein [Gossypium aridum]